jgi:hypothetical protein
MTPYFQRIEHKPEEGQYGDCTRACIASLLDIYPEFVPHFASDGVPDPDKFWAKVQDFLREHGVQRVTIPFKADTVAEVLKAMGGLNPGIYYMLGVGSPKANHSVIACGGEIVHDPGGYSDPSCFTPCDDGFIWVDYFVPLSVVNLASGYSPTNTHEEEISIHLKRKEDTKDGV